MLRLITYGQRKARRTHNCWCCNKSINKGTLYAYDVYYYDEIYELKLHIACRKLMGVYGHHFPDYDHDVTYPIYEWGELQSDNTIDWVAWDGGKAIPRKLEAEWRVVMGLPDFEER